MPKNFEDFYLCLAEKELRVNRIVVLGHSALQMIHAVNLETV